MTVPIRVECLLNRQSNSVSIILHDIPLENLDKVLGDMVTESWRTNVADGIRGQYVAGESLGLTRTERTFYTGRKEDS